MNNDLTETLSFKQTEVFLSYYLEQIKTVGLIEPLENYLNADTKLVNSINSLFHNLVANNTFQDSLKNMTIRFPMPVEFILINGFENSYLDIAIEEIIDIIGVSKDETEIYEKFSLLIDEKQNPVNSVFICEECFQDEFYKLIQRTNIEKAYKVILLQEKEEFFIQKFLGIKLTTYREPSHSKTFKTFYSKLNNLSENMILVIKQDEYIISTKEKNLFSISGKDVSFLIEFKE